MHWDTATGILGFPRGANETPLLSELSAPGLHHLFDTWLLFSCPVVSDSLRPHILQHASLSSTVSWSLLKLMSIEPVTPSSHLILCRPLLLPPSVFPRSASFPVSLPDGTYIDLAFKQVHPIDSWRWGDYTECSCPSGAAPRALTQAGSTAEVHSAPALGGLPDPWGQNGMCWCEYPCCLMAPFSISVLPIPVLISCSKFLTLVSFSDWYNGSSSFSTTYSLLKKKR